MAPNEVSGGTLSEALWKSIYAMPTSFPLSSSTLKSSIVRNNRKLIERLGLKTDCLLVMMLIEDENSTIRFRVIFAETLLHVDLNLSGL